MSERFLDVQKLRNLLIFHEESVTKLREKLTLAGDSTLVASILRAPTLFHEENVTRLREELIRAGDGAFVANGFHPPTFTTSRTSAMSDPSHDVQLLRVELLVAEKRVTDLREQLTQAGDGAFVASTSRGTHAPEKPDCL